MSGAVWTQEARAYVLANYGKQPSAEIAKALGRTPVSVRNIAHRMGLANTQDVAQRESRSRNPFGLSDREVQNLRSVAEGRTADAVGAHLNLSPSTVDGRMKSIRLRMGVYCTTRMVLKAERAGLLVGVEV